MDRLFRIDNQNIELLRNGTEFRQPVHWSMIGGFCQNIGRRGYMDQPIQEKYRYW